MVASLMKVADSKLQAEAKYRVNYTPNIAEVDGELRVIAPDTPYVAAAGRNRLYFIDTRFDPASAAHIKNQIEWAMTGTPGSYIKIDEVAVTAKVVDSDTGSTLFEFDPAYARVLFAAGINRRNPDLKLPEHRDDGEHIVDYDIGDGLGLQQRWKRCSDIGCYSHARCKQASKNYCDLCHQYRIDNECDKGMINAIGGCPGKICAKVQDTEQLEGESTSAYYQRMDTEHWHSRQ